MTYDAFDRMVEKSVGATYTQVLYSPIGKTAILNGNTMVDVYLPLPGGVTYHMVPGGQQFWLPDWLGTIRVSMGRNTRAPVYDRAFAPFGEVYLNFGATDRNDFTGDTQDILPGSDTPGAIVAGLYDTLNRELHPNQGRWISADPGGLGAVDLAMPQSWNRYAYVSNNPLSNVDPLGLDGNGCKTNPDGTLSCPDAGGSVTVYGQESLQPWLVTTNFGCVWTGLCNVPSTLPCLAGAGPLGVGQSRCAANNIATIAANNGTNNSILTPQQQKALQCIGQAAAAKGVSILLDVAGSIPGFGNLFSGTVEGIQALNAGYYGSVAVANAGNTLLNPSASGAANTVATVSLTVGSLALKGSRVIPVLGTAVSVLSLGYDAFKAVQVYQQCMAGGG